MEENGGLRTHVRGRRRIDRDKARLSCKGNTGSLRLGEIHDHEMGLSFFMNTVPSDQIFCIKCVCNGNTGSLCLKQFNVLIFVTLGNLRPFATL